MNSQNEIGCARISMMARSTNAPCKGRIQMRKTNPLHLFTFGLQRTAGPYSWVKVGRTQSEQMSSGLPLRADIARCGRHFAFVPGTSLLGRAAGPPTGGTKAHQCAIKDLGRQAPDRAPMRRPIPLAFDLLRDPRGFARRTARYRAIAES